MGDTIYHGNEDRRHDGESMGLGRSLRRVSEGSQGGLRDLRGTRRVRRDSRRRRSRERWGINVSEEFQKGVNGSERDIERSQRGLNGSQSDTVG